MNTIIKHPQSLPLVILRHEYLELTGNHCAAKLLAIFEFWTSKLHSTASKLGKIAREWIYKTLDALHGELMGEHGINSIRKALAQLIDLGFIDRQHDERMPQNRTYQYRLNVEALQRAVDNLHAQETQVTDAFVQTEECICPEEEIYIDPHLSSSPQSGEEQIADAQKEEEIADAQKEEEIADAQKEEEIAQAASKLRQLGYGFDRLRILPSLRESAAGALRHFGFKVGLSEILRE